MLRFWRSLAVLLVVAMLAAACGSTDSADTGAAAPGDSSDDDGGSDEVVDDEAASEDADSEAEDGSEVTASTEAESEESDAEVVAEESDEVEDEVEVEPVEDRAYYILPPGNYGGTPTTDESLDQLPLYDGLTPLRGDITDADIEEFFLPADFEPVGATTEEPTGRDGTTIIYDDFGVPHITGETREDLAFGAGWVTARDRGLLLTLGRGPSRVAVADVPGIDAFRLITSAQSFTPSDATEALVDAQLDLLIDSFGDEGQQIVDDASAYADGINAYWEANDVDQPPVDAADVMAVTAFIGSIFGAGGGSEAANAEFLSTLENAFGAEDGRALWEDAMGFDDPEAPTTIEERFDYGPLTGGEVVGSAPIDEGSVISLDPRDPAEGSAPVFGGDEGGSDEGGDDEQASAFYDAAGPVPEIQASNWLLVDPERSENGTTLAVQGPQLGYYYPEIVQQLHLSGPGIEAQGIGVPGLSMYLLIGRTQDYAWSLTSANHDVRDVFAEQLCEPDGAEPTRTSDHYEFNGDCVPFEIFDAGVLGTPDGPVDISYPVSVHGPVIGTATSDGRPIALTRQRSTFGRDGLNLAALKAMTEGEADTPETFFEVASRFEFTFNWGYVNRSDIAFFSSGLLPRRAPGLDRRLPTIGNGQFEWQGFLDLEEHPHADGHPSGRLLNWNNQSAPGFMHGDGTPFGAVHRVELFDQFPDKVDLAGVVGVMNRSATEDTHSPSWPVIRRVLGDSEAPSPLAGDVVALLDDWVADDAPTLDADDDGDYDHAGPTIMNALFRPLAEAVLEPVYGDALEDLNNRRGLNGLSGQSLVDKDLRTLLGDEVEGPYSRTYCGDGSLDDCRDSLWAAIDEVASELAGSDLAAETGDEPSDWLSEGVRTGFAPGLIPDTFRITNRPTYQHVIEFGPAS